MIPRDGGSFTAAPIKLTAAGSAQLSARLGPGRYLLYATAAFSFLQGSSAVVATANHHKISANSYFWVPVQVSAPSSVADADASCDGFISVFGTGDVYISKIGA